MTLTRRSLVAAAAAPALAPAVAAAATALPARAAFAPMPFTYLDSGSTHPMPLGAKAALEEYLVYKTRDARAPADYSVDAKERNELETLGGLIGATRHFPCVVRARRRRCARIIPHRNCRAFSGTAVVLFEAPSVTIERTSTTPGSFSSTEKMKS